MSPIKQKISKKDLDTPCLIIDKKSLEFNLNLMHQHSINTQINLRPHVKTHKCSQLAKFQIEHGAIGISAAKVSEADVLIDNGIKNILITSPVITKHKIARLISCLNKAPETMVVVDNKKNLQHLNEAGKSTQTKINVLIDLDPGIGRTGIKPESALNFAYKLSQYQWLNLMGIQCYAGNLQHIFSFEDRKKQSLEIMEIASNVVKQFRSQGFHCPILTGTGTGTFDIDVEASEVTEIQPGSYAVMDVEYSNIEPKSNNSLAKFKPAMSLLTTVISSNRKEHVTVDSGTKSIYFDIKNKPKIISHKGLHYDWGGFGDEHGKITAEMHYELPQNGEVIELIVPHCDPTINLYDKFYIVNDGIVEDVWEIDLRGKSQ